MQVCGKCSTPKPLEQFWRNRRRKNGRCSVCIECRSTQNQKRYAENRASILEADRNRYHKDPSKSREKHLKRKYGITIEDYNKLKTKQGCRCAVCNSHESIEKNGVFQVDHCHETGAVRGLLCVRCNFMIGYSRDNHETLRSAADYLESCRK